MVRIAPATIVVVLAGCLGAAAIGLTTYTQPLDGAASDPELVALLRVALHDSSPSIPDISSVLPIQSIAASDSETPSVIIEDDSLMAPGALAWVQSAATADPAALRDWLGRWVWATSVTDGDTVRFTLRRLSFHPGCPWLSRLDVLTAHSEDFATRLVRVTGTCPALAS